MEFNTKLIVFQCNSILSYSPIRRCAFSAGLLRYSPHGAQWRIGPRAVNRVWSDSLPYAWDYTLKLMFHKKYHPSISDDSGGSRIFQTGGRRQPIVLGFFLKKLHEIEKKNIGSRVYRARIPNVPFLLRSVNERKGMLFIQVPKKTLDV